MRWCKIETTHAHIYTGWWFGTFFIFPNSWDDTPIWLIFFRGVETTNQYIYRRIYIYIYISASWIPKNSKLHGETDDMVFWGYSMFRHVQTNFLLHEYFGGWSHSHCFRLLCRMRVAWLPKSWTYKGLERSWGPGWDMLRFIVICIDSCLFLSLRQLHRKAASRQFYHGSMV